MWFAERLKSEIFSAFCLEIGNEVEKFLKYFCKGSSPGLTNEQCFSLFTSTSDFQSNHWLVMNKMNNMKAHFCVFIQKCNWDFICSFHCYGENVLKTCSTQKKFWGICWVEFVYFTFIWWICMVKIISILILHLSVPNPLQWSLISTNAFHFGNH